MTIRIGNADLTILTELSTLLYMYCVGFTSTDCTECTEYIMAVQDTEVLLFISRISPVVQN